MFDSGYYIKNLWLISLGILFNVDQLTLQNIQNMLLKSNINDWLYNYFLSYKNINLTKIEGDFLFKDVYGRVATNSLCGRYRNSKTFII
ncbi:MAG: hypothetical protein GX896_00910 [Clostridiales bacterium]|nr:hypothetical protein [Clostridiales bacterium]